MAGMNKRVVAILALIVMVGVLCVAPVSAFARPWHGGGHWGGHGSRELDIELSDYEIDLECMCAASGNTADVTIDSVTRRWNRPVDDWGWELVSNTDDCVATVDPDWGTKDGAEPIHIIAGCEGTTVLTIEVFELDRRGRPTGRYGEAEITVNVTCNCVFVNPTITGPTGAVVEVGYKAFSAGPFTLAGTPAPYGTKLTGDPAITWNEATKSLDIAAGLPVGTYPVELVATNDQTCCECDEELGPIMPLALVSSSPWVFTLTVTKAKTTTPPTGDTLGLLAPSLMVLGSFVCLAISSEWRKRH